MVRASDENSHLLAIENAGDTREGRSIRNLGINLFSEHRKQPLSYQRGGELRPRSSGTGSDTESMHRLRRKKGNRM